MVTCRGRFRQFYADLNIPLLSLYLVRCACFYCPCQDLWDSLARVQYLAASGLPQAHRRRKPLKAKMDGRQCRKRIFHRGGCCLRPRSKYLPLRSQARQEYPEWFSSSIVARASSCLPSMCGLYCDYPMERHQMDRTLNSRCRFGFLFPLTPFP